MRILKLILIFTISLNMHAASENIIGEFLDSVPHEVNLTRSQLSRIQEELRIQSLLLQSLERIKIEGGTFVNLDNAAIKTTNAIIEAGLLKYSVSDEIQKTKLKDVLSSPINKENIKGMLTQVSELTKRMGQWQFQEFNSAYRTKGLFYALVKFASIQLDTTIPAALILSGNFLVGAGMLVTPISPQTIVPFKIYKEAILNFKLMRELGLNKEGTNRLKAGLEKFKIYRNIAKISAGNLFGQIDYMNTRMSPNGETLRIQQEGFLNRYIFRKGYKEALNYTNLIDFLKKYESFTELITRLENSTLSKELKTYSILAYIENTASESMTEDFLNRFEKSIVRQETTNISQTHITWARRIAKSRDFKKFYTLLVKLPEDLAPKSLDLLWREYILPKLADSMEGGISRTSAITFQNIAQMAEVNHRARFTQSTDTIIGLENKNLFVDEIFHAMSRLNPCQFVLSPIPRGLR